MLHIGIEIKIKKEKKNNSFSCILNLSYYEFELGLRCGIFEST